MSALAGIAVTAFLVAFSGAMVPGPLTLLTVERGARQGWAAGFWVTLGHALAEGVLVGAVLGGVGPLLVRPVVAATASGLGAVALVFMGAAMVRNPGPAPAVAVDGGVCRRQRSSPAATVAAGLAATVANPYWVVWWASVGLAYLVTARSLGAAGLAAFLGGHLGADLVVGVAVASLAAAGGGRVGEQWYPRAVRVLGVFLLLMGGYFVQVVVRMVQS